MAAPIRFLSGRQQQQKIGIEGSTEDKKVLEVVGRTGIGTTSFEPAKILDVRGDAIVEGTTTVGKLEITGTGDVPASLTVETANITGVSTFGGAVDVNAGLDVDGQADLDEVVVAGVATFSNAVDINSTLDVDGDTQLDDLTVAGVATFSSAINATDIIKGYEYTAAPFGSTITLAVTVASKDSTHRYNGTGSGNAYVIDGIQAPFLTLTPGRTYRFTNDNTGSHPLKFYLEADKTTLYETNVDFQDTYTEITVTDETPTVLHYQCTAHQYMGNAVQTNANVVNTNYPATIRSTLDVTGVSTFPQLDVSTGGLDVDGLTNLDEVVVAGVSTFTGNIVAVSAEFSGNVTIAGTLTAEDKTNIDSLGIVTARTGVRVDAGGLIVTAGVSTFTDSVDIDNGVGVVGGLTADSLTISGVTTGINAAGISSFVRIDVDGQADLDEVVVAGAATFSGSVNFDVNSEVNIGTGVTILGNNLHVTGIVSATQFIGDGSGITNLPGISTLGSSNLTDVNVSGTTTTTQLRISGIGTAEKFFVSTGGLEVDGQTDLDELIVAGVSTFNANTNVVGDLSVTGDIGASGIITATGINLVAGSGLDVGAIGVLTALSVDVNTGGIDVDGQATLDEVVVAGVSTFTGTVNIDGALDIGVAGVDVEGLTNLDELIVAGVSTFQTHVHLGDSDELRFGAGDDLKIYHNGSTSLIDNTTVGSIAIRQLVDDADVVLQSDDGSGGVADYIRCDGSEGEVRLYHYGNEKLNTKTDGVTVSGELSSDSLNCGTGGLDVDGQTDLDELVVAGVSTFSAKAVFNTAYPSIDADNEIQVGTAIQLGKAGVITATSFSGDGSALTGIAATDHVSTFDLVVAGISTFNDTAEIRRSATNSNPHLRLFAGDSNGSFVIAEHASSHPDLEFKTSAGGSTLSLFRGAAQNTVGSETLDGIGLEDFKSIIFGTGNDAYMRYDPTPGVLDINTVVSEPITFGTNNVERLRIAADGLVSVSGIVSATGITVVAGAGLTAGNTGVITAVAFHGDGSALTGVGTQGARVEAESLTVAGVSTFTGIATHINTLHGQTLKIAGVSTFSDAVTITKASNALNVNVLTSNPAINIQSNGSTKGSLTPQGGEFRVQTSGTQDLALQVNSSGESSGEISLKSVARTLLKATHNGGVAVSGILTATAINVVAGSGEDAGNTGVVTAVAFHGDGSALTGISAGFSADSQGNLYAGNDAGAASDADTLNNIAIGNSAGKSLNAGDYNIFLGESVGTAFTGGSYNVAIGRSAVGAGASNSCYNVFIGNQAGCKANLGCVEWRNVVIGDQAGACMGRGLDNPNTYTGTCYNVLIGSDAGMKTYGYQNIFIGNLAGPSNTGAGRDAQASGNDNIALGYGNGRNIQNACYNILMGYCTGNCVVGEDYNVFMGYQAGWKAPTNRSFFVGYWAGACANGDSNIAIGCRALDCTSTGTNNIFLGDCAGRSAHYADGHVGRTGANNIGIGMSAMYSKSSGSNNLALGTRAGAGGTMTGSYNIFMGHSAGYHNSSGKDNISIGASTGYCNTTGNCNVFIGMEAGKCVCDSSNNVIIGHNAGRCSNASSGAVMIGHGAGEGDFVTNSGFYSVFVGEMAGADNRGGQSDVFIGACAGCNNRGGNGNVFLGRLAGTGNNDQDHSIMIGCSAGHDQTAGDRNVIIGCRGILPVKDASDQIIFTGGYTYPTPPYSYFYGCCNGGCVLTGIGTEYPDTAVGAAITSKLAVGVVSTYNLYADGGEFNGTSRIKVPVGSTAQRPSSPVPGDFRYNSDDGAFEGYTDSWGSIGGGTPEVDTNVSSTSAVGVGSFATASFRSAEVIAQIVQIDEYQVGKYLMIHDGTTVTVIEQAAVATGDAMLGSFDGAINGSNAELRVNMVSSGIATVTTKISTVTI